MFESFSRPVLFAHRGASARAPENTLAAFALAVKEGADAVELDAKLTLDCQVVVIHDQTTLRTTGVKGTVNQMLLKDIKNLEAGSGFDPKFMGEQIPTLDEVFEAVGKQLLIDVELTNYTSPHDELVERVVEIVKRHQMEKRVLFSSFFAINLRRVAVLLPEVERGLLCHMGILGALGRSSYGRRVSPDIILPYFTDVNERYIANERAQNRSVIVWTVDAADDLRRMSDLQLKGIITNDPIKAREVLEEK